MAIAGTREARTQELRLEEVTEREESNFIKSLFPDGEDSLGGLGAGGADYPAQGQQGQGDYLPVAGGTMIGAIAFFPKLIEIADDSINIGKALGQFTSRVIINAEGAPTSDNLVTIFNAEHAGQILILQGTTGETITIRDMNGTQTAWATSTGYVVGDLVSNGGVVYTCYTAHTSSASDEPGVGANWEDYWHKANIMTVDGSDFTLSGEDNLLFVFDSVSNSWRQMTTGAQGVTGGANKTLSNLTAPTAINQPLLSEASDTHTIGDSTFYFSSVHTKALRLHGTHATPGPADNTGIYKTATGMDLHATINTDVFKFIFNGVTELTISSTQINADGKTLNNLDGLDFDDFANDPIANGEFRLNGTDMKVYSGGAVRNLSDIVAGGGANVFLSNLSSPTAVNQDLAPDGSNTRDLGGSTFYWSEIHGNNLRLHGTHAEPTSVEPAGLYKTAQGLTFNTLDAGDLVKFRFNGTTQFTITQNQVDFTGSSADNIVGITLDNFGSDPIADGEIRLNGVHVKVGTNSGVVSLSDIALISGKADGDLNNLSATSINQDLIPNGSGTLDLGNSTFYWWEIHGNNLRLHGTHATPSASDNTGVYKTATGLDFHATINTDVFKFILNGVTTMTISSTQVNVDGKTIDNADGLTFDDFTTDPIANGEFRLNGADMKVYSGGAVRNLSDIGAGGGSPLTTKGDLYTYTTVDARLPVGNDRQVLLAESSQSTGLVWADLNEAHILNASNYWSQHSNHSVWICPSLFYDVSAGGFTNQAVTLQRYCYPLFISAPTTLKNLSPYVGTASNSQMKTAIYENSTNGENYPGTKVAETSQQFLSGTGFSTSVASYNLALDPGLYWIVVQFESTTNSSVYRLPAGNLHNVGYENDPNTTGPIVGWQEVNTGSTAFPTSFTSITDADVSPITGSTGLVPVIWARF